jgi:PAS domain S-box-containing protein
MLDPDGRVATWNEGAERIHGYAENEILGRDVSEFYQAEAVSAGTPKEHLELATRLGAFEEEGWRLRRDGSRFWAGVLLTPLRHEDGKLVGFANVTRDLTERRRLEERAIEDARRAATEEAARQAAEQRVRELRRLADQLHRQATELEARRKEAEDANLTKSQFLAAMSHELRTPLNAIGGYAELLEMELSGPVTEQQRAHLQRIRRSQQHLLGIINDILNFSRLEAGQLTYDLGPVPVAAVVESVTQMVLPQAQGKGLGLISACEPPDLLARADRAKVEQIVLNLVSNAVKFTDAGGRITVSCSTDGDRVLVAVEDTGIGIPPAEIEKIFEPFVQVGRSLTNLHEGTGLGLAISRDLARAMRGDITVKSGVGRGSCFTLILPRERHT